MTIKKREINVIDAAIGTEEFVISGIPVSRTIHRANVGGLQQTLTNGHAYPPTAKSMRMDPLRDRGGSFEMLKRTIVSEPANVDAHYLYGDPAAPNGWVYKGLVFADTLAARYTSLPTPPNGLLVTGMGVKGWNRYKPNASQGGLSQFLGELRDLPRLPKLLALKGQAKSFAQLQKDIGSDYLNLEFGWRPFVNDLRDFVRNTEKADMKLRQLARDNNKFIRRRGPVFQDMDRQVESSKGYFTLPTLPSYMYVGVQEREVETTVTQKWWFSGKFKYYIPTGNSPKDVATRKRQLARIIYGAELNANLLYQLTPWSWLVDWIAPIGDMVDNLSDWEDNLTAQYAYIMCLQSTVKKVTVRGEFAGHGKFETTQTYVDEVKIRHAASPFGFGYTFTGFSSKQLAILAALGMSRGRAQ